MFNVLIDTCVWLDLAADPRQRGLLETLDAFGHLGHIQLIVPRLVVQEFGKNRERVAKASAKGISTQVQQVKEAVRALELNGRRKKALLASLDDLKHKIPQLGKRPVIPSLATADGIRSSRVGAASGVAAALRRGWPAA